ncbi:hypothetical protein GOP47_0021874 [Adiantum capillus-veneris]|uniref:Uncharacterized protein n=1 Tax=Adiantum capillus-veneris TaxID=13818 RepID=A0A9D4U963_ADICA|nr:hypothetical protein GOP47_0021874 [Adiantum capillus-veneris]
MPLCHPLPASEFTSSHVAEFGTSGSRLDSSLSVRDYGGRVPPHKKSAGECLPYLPHPALLTQKRRDSALNVISRDSLGFPDRGDNLHCSHVRKHNGMLASCQRAKMLICASHSTDMGFSNTQMYVPLLEDSYEKSLFFASHAETYSAPHPEVLDPFSQLLYQHAMGRNLHWWRFLAHCRAQLNSTLFARRRYSLVGKEYTKVLLPTRFASGVLSVPAISVPLKQDPLSTTLDCMNLAASEALGWFAQMGDRYGSSLLCLLVLGYWIQGLRCFPWMAMSFYLKDGLQVDPGTLQFLMSTVNLPMVAKPAYGIISDVIYIGGARRMPYLMFAGALQVLSWSTIALHSGIRSSVAPLMGVLLVSNVGAAVAEVVNDALVAESVQKEVGRSKGELQSFVWLALATGGVIGNLAGGFAMSRLSSTTMFSVFAMLAAGHLVVSSIVKESSFNFKSQTSLKSKDSSNSTSAFKVLRLQASKLVGLVSMPEIALPLAWFAASYACIPAMGGSLFFFQTQHLKIHPTFLGLAKVMGQMGLLAGSLLYNRYWKSSSPRKMLLAVQILLSGCMLSDILLVSRMNIKLGIPDQIFVLGASAFVEAIAQFKVLPFTVLLTQLCPAGSEGSLLAFFMSCHCLASIMSGYMGTIVGSFLHLSADNFSGLPLGILIQSLAALIPLFWISCIPSSTNKVAVQ